MVHGDGGWQNKRLTQTTVRCQLPGVNDTSRSMISTGGKSGVIMTRSMISTGGKSGVIMTRLYGDLNILLPDEKLLQRPDAISTG